MTTPPSDGSQSQNQPHNPDILRHRFNYGGGATPSYEGRFDIFRYRCYLYGSAKSVLLSRDTDQLFRSEPVLRSALTSKAIAVLSRAFSFRPSEAGTRLFQGGLDTNNRIEEEKQDEPYSMYVPSKEGDIQRRKATSFMPEDLELSKRELASKPHLGKQSEKH